MLKGGKLSIKNIKLLLNASYNNKLSDIGDWILDTTISNNLVQVYKNKNSDQAVVVHRGTASISDVGTDIKLTFGFKNNKRFNDARKIQNLAEEKYGASNVTTLGHSLGAAIAEEVGQNSKEIITFNKPILPTDIFTKKKIGEHQYDIKTKNDPFSFLKPLQQDKKDIIIQSETKNPLIEHSVNALERVDPELMGGDNRIQKMKLKEIKEFLKKLKKLNKDIKIGGLKKIELKELALKYI